MIKKYRGLKESYIKYVEDDINTTIELFKWKLEDKNNMAKPIYNLDIKKVIFNNPAIIVYWSDYSKTVVKLDEKDKLDPEKGLAMAIIKRKFGLKDFFKYIQ